MRKGGINFWAEAIKAQRGNDHNRQAPTVHGKPYPTDLEQGKSQVVARKPLAPAPNTPSILLAIRPNYNYINGDGKTSPDCSSPQTPELFPVPLSRKTTKSRCSSRSSAATPPCEVGSNENGEDANELKAETDNHSILGFIQQQSLEYLQLKSSMQENGVLRRDEPKTPESLPLEEKEHTINILSPLKLSEMNPETTHQKVRGSIQINEITPEEREKHQKMQKKRLDKKEEKQRLLHSKYLKEIKIYFQLKRHLKIEAKSRHDKLQSAAHPKLVGFFTELKARLRAQEVAPLKTPQEEEGLQFSMEL